ncbi:MAG: N-acetyltransferase, partial [Nitrospina sp.]|nr:N-acetyltransferase [Nitrospina sp.]
MPSGPTFIHPTSEVSDDALVGEGTAIWNWSKVRERAILGEQCNVGQSVYI